VENLNWIDILIQLIVCWLCYRLGYANAIKSIADDVIENLRNKGMELELDENGDVVAVKSQGDETILVIEPVGRKYYAYTDAGEFIAQGENFTIMFIDIKSRFPNQSFKIAKEQKMLTEEEMAELIKSVSQIFGEKHENQTGQHVA
jgi:hypothetical protein